MMSKKIDLTGKRFGRLIVLHETDIIYSPSRWVCICDCGKLKESRGTGLTTGDIKSCGCLIKDFNREKVVHGKTKTAEYRAWISAKSRCYNKNCAFYYCYGARGITMIDKWVNSFETFFKDMGTKPTRKHSLERIDNNKGYCKGNCKWATQKEQSRNKRGLHIIEYKGEKMVQADWVKRCGTTYSWFFYRIKRYGILETMKYFNQ